MIKVCIGSNMGRTTSIIDENTTLRAAFEANNVDYSVGMSSLDGSTLRPGDLDKTFKDFGIAEKCFLMNVVKADNAAKIKLAGSAAVIESDIDFDDLAKVAKYRPEELTLYKGEGSQKEPVFAVGIAKAGTGSINSFGASFAPNGGYGNKAIITMLNDSGEICDLQWVEAHIGLAILNLNKIEENLGAVVTAINDDLSKMNAAVVIA